VKNSFFLRPLPQWEGVPPSHTQRLAPTKPTRSTLRPPEFHPDLRHCISNKAIVGMRFAPGAATWQTRRNNVMFDFGLLALLCDNITSYTKLEVYNLLHRRQRRSEPLTPPLTTMQ